MKIKKVTNVNIGNCCTTNRIKVITEKHKLNTCN